MATAPGYDSNVDQFGAAVEPKSKASGCLKGCLIAAVVIVVLVVVIALVLAFTWRAWGTRLGTALFNSAIDNSQLPPQEKIDVKAQVDRAMQAVRNGTMTSEQFTKLMQGLVESPLISMLVASGLEKQYLDKSGLSEEEKTAGRQTLRRAWRGVFDKKIPEASLDTMMQHIADRGPNGHWQVRQQVTDDELRAFLAEAKAAADKAEIPDQPQEIDVSDEVKRVIDEALGPQAAEAPPK